MNLDDLRTALTDLDGELLELVSRRQALSEQVAAVKRATGRAITTIDDAMAAGKRLCAELSLDHAFITLDSDGIVVAQSDGSAEHLPTRKREVYDITGAGDMVLAMIGLGAAAGIQPVESPKNVTQPGSGEPANFTATVLTDRDFYGVSCLRIERHS